MEDLRSYIINYFLDKQDHYDLFVPYSEGNAHSTIKGKTNILSTVNHEKGIFYRIRIPQFLFERLGIKRFILSPEDPLRKQFLEQS